MATERLDVIIFGASGFSEFSIVSFPVNLLRFGISSLIKFA